MRRALIALACAAALVALVGCGESDQEQAREVVQEFVDARADSDAEAECDLYAESYKQELAVGENCAGFVEEASSGAAPGELEVIEVRVNGDKGSADIDILREGGEGPARISLLLTRESDDEWRIAGFQ